MCFKKKKSLYSENIDVSKVCATCVYATEIKTTGDFMCEKHGIVKEDNTCKRYFYNRLMKHPKKNRNLLSYSPDEFSID